MRTILSLILLSMVAGSASRARQEESAQVLNLAQAREYMLELINKDRATKGLKPVAIDPIAETVGQKHAEEMAANAFMSHFDLRGRLPDQRYTEAGGMDRVQENVFFASGGNAKESTPLPLLKDAVFRKKELESVQAAYFNQVPPHDLHRRNILDPHHTHVGIGLARAVRQGGQTFANTQQFVARHITVDPLPAEVKVGDAVVISGRAPEGLEFYSIDIGRDELPQPRDRASLANSGPYRTPRNFVQYYPEHPEPDKRTSAQPDRRFRVLAHLTDNGKPGVYYVRIRVENTSGERFCASQRTVVVREPETARTPIAIP